MAAHIGSAYCSPLLTEVGLEKVAIVVIRRRWVFLWRFELAHWRGAASHIKAQKPFEPAQEQAEIVAGTGEVIAAHPVFDIDAPN
jgi:hypothetical protein